jgi:prolyl-tRNA synthetase
MLYVYRDFMENWMAMPPLLGQKSDSEKFPGAVRTYATEALMQDNRALQAGTSHMLGQNFARQFDLRFQTEAGGEDYAYNTSWGVSTRLIGGLVMTHGDDAGLILPPRLAPIQVVIVPIYRTADERSLATEKAAAVAAALRDRGVRVHVDARDNLKPGPKFYEWERKGVPTRIEVGPKDIARESLVLVHRFVTVDAQRKESLPETAAIETMTARLDRMQRALLDAAVQRREANSWRDCTDYAQLRARIDTVGGFHYAGWCGGAACEERVKNETKATIRVLPFAEFRSPRQPDSCIVCGGSARTEAVWAKAY